jgi:hypothetical protein
VGILRRAQRLRIIIVFVDPTLLTLLISFLFYFCFSFLSFFFWARLYCGPSKLTVSCGCYINIAGREPVSRGLEHACIIAVWLHGLPQDFMREEMWHHTNGCMPSGLHMRG